jgi:GntR family transcriptional regulator/MocR family aminotransferase
LAGYLARARGVLADPERIVVCSGFTQGLALICQVLRGRGEMTVGVEEFGVMDHRRIIDGFGLAMVSVPVDDAGARPEGLDGTGGLVLTPAHQFPIGVVLSPGRRSQVIEWASGTGGLIVEDDYDGEFRYDRQPVGALQALAPDLVVFAGTASKSLAPGLRLGWLAVPAALLDEVVAAKTIVDRHSANLDQLTLAELITSGGYDRQIRRARLVYRRRRDRLVSEIGRTSPGVRITGIAAGLHALLELPTGRTERDVLERAAARGLAVDGLGEYTTSEHRRRPALVVGYGTPPQHSFTAALARLSASLSG